MSRVLALIGVVALAGILLAIGLGRAPQVAPRGFLGLVLAPLSRATASRTPLLSGGAEIAYVYPGSPADKAKLDAGEVVTAVDGVHVDSAENAAQMIEARAAGDVVALSMLDVARDQSRKPEVVRVAVAPGPARNEKVFTVHVPRVLAREGGFAPSMAANAAWSAGISHGAVNPYPLRVFAAERCSAVAPYGWKIVRSPRDDDFALASGGGHIRSFYRREMLGATPASDLAATLHMQLAAMFGGQPELEPVRQLANGFSVADFATANDYSGFALYHLVPGKGRTSLSLWVAGVPATEREGLIPYAGAVALSIRCANGHGIEEHSPTGEAAPTSVSSRCLAGECDESDFAGAYNDTLHTGYVHSRGGENFLIDPRKDIWAMGPDGPGTYRQNNGMLEKLEPGRTN